MTTILLVNGKDDQGNTTFQALQAASFTVTWIIPRDALKLAPKALAAYDLIIVAYDHGANSDGHNTMAGIRTLVGPEVSEFLEILCYVRAEIFTVEEKNAVFAQANSVVRIHSNDLEILLAEVHRMLTSGDEAALADPE